jgi:AbiTii/Putative DNA-binding domain
MLDKAGLNELLALNEELPKVEFKLKYVLSGQGKQKALDELAKDIIALANTAGRSLEDYAYLIIGAGDKLKSNGTRDYDDVRQYSYNTKTFLQIANARCNPPLSVLCYRQIELDSRHYGAVIIAPSPHMHTLIRDLDTPSGLWRKSSVLIRHGDEVAQASFDEMEAMKREKGRLSTTDTLVNSIADLVSKIQSKTISLSQCVAEALIIARKLRNETLEYICQKELRGWHSADVADNAPHYRPTYRLIEVFMGTNQLNMQYVGFGHYTKTIDFLRNSGEFTVSKLLMGEPLSQLEAKVPPHPDKSIGTLETTLDAVNPKAKRPKTKVYLYFSPFVTGNIIEAVRTEITKHLIDLLPTPNY